MSPDTITCTATDNDGVTLSTSGSLIGGEGSGALMTMTGASLTNAVGSQAATITVNGLGTRTFTFISDAASSITGNAPNLMTVTAGSTTVLKGTWALDAGITNSGGNGIVINTPVGTGSSLLGTSSNAMIMTVGAPSVINTSGNALTFNGGGVVGVSSNNFTVNNGGAIYAGGNGIVMTSGVIAGGNFVVVNDNIMGTVMTPIGGSAVVISGTLANGSVTNNGAGQMVSNGDTIVMTQGGTGTVTNYGTLTSINGRAVKRT